MEFERFKILTFDCYGTLIDWETGILRVLRPWAERHSLVASDDKLLRAFAREESEMERMMSGVLYPDVLRAVMNQVAAAFDVEPDPEDADALAHSVADWPPFPDSAAALAKLKRRFKLGIISNINHASFAHSDEKLGIDWDLVVTAEDAGAYKPDPRPFQMAIEVLEEEGIEKGEILHVAQSLFHDHVTAKALELATVWVDRRRGLEGWGATPPPEAPVRPDLVVATLAELADLVAG